MLKNISQTCVQNFNSSNIGTTIGYLASGIKHMKEGKLANGVAVTAIASVSALNILIPKIFEIMCPEQALMHKVLEFEAKMAEGKVGEVGEVIDDVASQIFDQ